MSWSPKSPADVADYYVDWTDFVSADEAISGVTVTADTGITVNVSDYTGKVVRARLSGGTSGTTYNVTFLITTTSGETFSVTKRLIVLTRVEPW